MAVTVDPEARSLPAPTGRSIRLGGRDVPVILPKLRDPRIHLAITTFTIITIGMVWLDFRLSIPQVAVALLACGLLDVVRTYRTQAVLAWPASALQTATSERHCASPLADAPRPLAYECCCPYSATITRSCLRLQPKRTTAR